MQGHVNNSLEPKLKIRLYASDGSSIDVEALIDTGCTFPLVVEKTLVEHVLRLNHVMDADVRQADGSSTLHPVYRGRIEWKGALREVNAVAMGNEVIIGMAMLRSCHWQMNVTPGGDLIIS